MSLFEG